MLWALCVLPVDLEREFEVVVSLEKKISIEISTLFLRLPSTKFARECGGGWIKILLFSLATNDGTVHV